MTWYRVGPAGIPGSLKTDMDAVLNKKFGTSTTYAPSTWPDTVNLMGPLPEKTSSGAIANITDGADGVPLKNWLVTLPASLDGYTAIHGTKNTGTGTPETQYTASLGRTIYGGTVDIVTGEGEDGYNAPITINGSENWQKHGSLISWFYVDNLLVDAYANNAETGFIASSWGTQKAYSQVSSLANGEYAYGAINRFVIKNTDFTEVADFKTWLSSNPITLVCKSDTPETFTFTPIPPTPETALGSNNFWADEGDSDVTYRADISLALQALGGGGRGLMGMIMQRPEEEQLTEEDPEEVPEETETNER